MSKIIKIEDQDIDPNDYQAAMTALNKCNLLYSKHEKNQTGPVSILDYTKTIAGMLLKADDASKSQKDIAKHIVEGDLSSHSFNWGDMSDIVHQGEQVHGGGVHKLQPIVLTTDKMAAQLEREHQQSTHPLNNIKSPDGTPTLYTNVSKGIITKEDGTKEEYMNVQCYQFYPINHTDLVPSFHPGDWENFNIVMKKEGGQWVAKELRTPAHGSNFQAKYCNGNEKEYNVFVEAGGHGTRVEAPKILKFFNFVNQNMARPDGQGKKVPCSECHFVNLNTEHLSPALKAEIDAGKFANTNSKNGRNIQQEQVNAIHNISGLQFSNINAMNIDVSRSGSFMHKFVQSCFEVHRSRNIFDFFNKDTNYKKYHLNSAKKDDILVGALHRIGVHDILVTSSKKSIFYNSNFIDVLRKPLKKIFAMVEKVKPSLTPEDIAKDLSKNSSFSDVNSKNDNLKDQDHEKKTEKTHDIAHKESPAINLTEQQESTEDKTLPNNLDKDFAELQDLHQQAVSNDAKEDVKASKLMKEVAKKTFTKKAKTFCKKMDKALASNISDKHKASLHNTKSQVENMLKNVTTHEAHKEVGKSL